MTASKFDFLNIGPSYSEGQYSARREGSWVIVYDDLGWEMGIYQSWTAALSALDRLNRILDKKAQHS